MTTTILLQSLSQFWNQNQSWFWLAFFVTILWQIPNKTHEELWANIMPEIDDVEREDEEESTASSNENKILHFYFGELDSTKDLKIAEARARSNLNLKQYKNKII